MPTTVPVLVDWWRSADHPQMPIAAVWKFLCMSYSMPPTAKALDVRPVGDTTAPPIMRWEIDEEQGVIRGGVYVTSVL